MHFISAMEMRRTIFFALKFSCASLLASPAFLDPKILLLQKVLQIRSTNYITIYNCWKHPDALRINKFLNSNNIRAIFQRISENDTYEYNNRKLPRFSYVLDATCNEMEHVLFQFNSKHEFESDYKWYILTEEGNPNRNALYLKELFNQLQLRMDSDVLLLIYKLHGHSVSFFIEDLYNLSGKLGNEVVTTTARESTDFLHALNTIRYKRRSNMTVVTLRVSTDVSIAPEEYLQNGRHIEVVQKLSLASIFLLRSIHNFSIRFVPAKKLNDFDDFSLLREDIDVPATMMFINEKVITNYDTIIPAYPFRQCFVYKRSETTKNEYLAPFSSSVWYCVLSLAILVPVVIKLVFHMEERSKFNGEFSWTAAFLILISVYSQQGTSIVPSYTAGRIIILCLLIISVHLYNSYVSTIVSSLLYPSVSTYGRPDELIHDSFKLGFENVDFNPFTKYNSGFVFTNDSVRFKDKRYQYYDVPEGLGNVRKGQFAFHAEVPIHYPTISRSFSLPEFCELQEFDVFPKLYPSLVAPKHSQYVELFKISFRRVIERGILQREIMLLLAKKPPCLGVINVKQLSIKYVLPAFVLFGFGVVASMVFLLLELSLSCALKRK